MKARAQIQPSYRYRDLELALARVFAVTPEDMPAFRARIRHLRNLGIPEIAKPGSGQKITYTRTNAIQLLMALETELLGLPPALAASFARSQKDRTIKDADAAAGENKPYVVAVEPNFSFNINDAWIFKIRSGDKIPLVDAHEHRRTIVNLATSISLLDDALRHAMERSQRLPTGLRP